MNDLISRQAAIAELNEIAKMKHAILDSLNISDRRARDMIEAELGQINDDIDSIKDMPSAQPEVLAHGEGELSAQPEIIRCKECIYFDKYIDCKEMYQWDGFCADWARNTYENWYCSRAERRNDG